MKIDTTSDMYAARDARISPHSTAPTAASLQGRGVSAAVAGNAFGSAWRLRGTGAIAFEFDSQSGGVPV